MGLFDGIDEPQGEKAGKQTRDKQEKVVKLRALNVPDANMAALTSRVEELAAQVKALKEQRPQIAFTPEDRDGFLKWVRSLNPEDYPAEAANIRHCQNFTRIGEITKPVDLYVTWFNNHRKVLE